MSPPRPTVLVIHDDGDVLDLLTRSFEASNCEVLTAVTGFRAQAILEGERPIAVVIAPWDDRHPVGGDVYRWALQQRYDLRDQFVFLAAEVPGDFDRLVAGRCLAVSIARPQEVVRVAIAAIRRRANLDARAPAAGTHDRQRPSLLLAEDEPILLTVIGSLFGDAGFAVTQVESGLAAIARLDQEDYDVVVVDWGMDEGNGEDVFRWILRSKPWLAGRLVFLTGSIGEVEEVTAIAPGRPTFPKGADAAALTTAIREIAATSALMRTKS
ncbi:MAG: response regulator [Proteobacteria bacterium]|nr:response regulator [Pseudomonadota bacterium]